jgi:hypothetical protein
MFARDERTLLVAGGVEVSTFAYPSGIEAVRVGNGRGHLVVLPFMGQIIWDAEFDGVDLKMKNMFRQPVPAQVIADTYGCFAFHSGLLAAGCPAPDDDHPLHGEMACAPMDEAWLEVEDNQITVTGRREYVKGFGFHYTAVPAVTLRSGESSFRIGMHVENLSEYAPMPLQYMCHMNYAYVEGGTFRQSIPDAAIAIRETIPAHVHPTPEWTRLNEDIKSGRIDTGRLDYGRLCDPEICFFADDLPRYGPQAEFCLERGDGTEFFTEFPTAQFPEATRWILYNPDQQVAAFVLPGTSRPEGRNAARKAGTLIELEAHQSRDFEVRTGLRQSGGEQA